MLEINDIIIVLGYIFGLLLFANAKNLNQTSHVPKKKISVIIPVRDEEHNIARLLFDLKKQTYPLHEIICVDDSSRDGTREVIAGFDVTLISAGGLPEGWKGKPWACQRGADNATGDVLLFLDADVSLDDGAVEALASNFDSENSCISVQPFHKTKKTYEQISMLFNAVQAAATGMGMAPCVKNTGFFGPVLMISRKLFFENGGYNPVKSETVEDYILGSYYCGKNTDISLFLGGRHISYRMYPLGPVSLIEGWTKNFSTGAAKTRWWRLLMIVVFITALTALPIEIIQSVVRPDAARLIYLSVFYVLFVINLIIASRKLGSFKVLTCVLYPFVLLAFHLIFIYSVVCTYIMKNTTWKGRKL